jgi:hypothetical protein
MEVEALIILNELQMLNIILISREDSDQAGPEFGNRS